MRCVRIRNGVVAEIIPDYAMPVVEWYGEMFAAQCVEAPDEVGQRWRFDSGVFLPPAEPEPTHEEDIDALLVDHEYRLTLVELGI